MDKLGKSWDWIAISGYNMVNIYIYVVHGEYLRNQCLNIKQGLQMVNVSLFIISPNGSRFNEKIWVWLMNDH